MSPTNSALGISLREVMVKNILSTVRQVSQLQAKGKERRLTIKASHICYAEAIRDNLTPSIRVEMLREDCRSAQYPVA